MTTPTRDRILEVARSATLERGFSAVRLDQVLQEAGASKGAFFHHFRSKADLGRALVERYAADDAALLDGLIASAEARSSDPAEQLLDVIGQLEAGAVTALVEQPSCLFVSFIYEGGLAEPETSRLIDESIRHWRSELRRLLEAAAPTSPGLAGVDLDSLADHAFTVIEGAFLLARALDDPTAMAAQLGHLRRYLELLLVGSGSS